MPLNCDCYPGCWGDHSEGWSEIADPQDKFRIRAVKSLPYGTYVTVKGKLRVETQELLERIRS